MAALARTAVHLRGLLPSRADYHDLRRTWKGDLVGGLTVGIVAFPSPSGSASALV